MAPSPDPDWVRRLAPLILAGEPLDVQLARRFGATLVASALFGGFLLFFLALFAGFGRWPVGVAIDLGISPVLARIWLDYWRIRRVVAEYRAGYENSSPGRNHRPG